MKNKVLALLAASAAALGSVILAAPAHAVTADLPVEVKVEPYIYLRTYKSLKFVVTQKDLGGISSDQTPAYDESSPITLDKTPPAQGTASGTTVPKTVSPLYLIWGAQGGTANVAITASKDTLTGPSGKTAKLSITSGATATYSLDPIAPKSGDVGVNIDFGNSAAAGSYTGGMLTISATNP